MALGYVNLDFFGHARRACSLYHCEANIGEGLRVFLHVFGTCVMCVPLDGEVLRLLVRGN